MEVLEKLITYYKNDKISHAYLIETNDIEKCYLDLLEVIRQINCPNEYSKECKKCNLCNLLNKNSLPSLIVIWPDGKNIKKEQILSLKKQFSTKPIYTKENIYIINQAETLNASSANTMLKFLEEPEDDILGFFITNNSNNVINTIKSRCELLVVNYKETSEIVSYLPKSLEYLNKIDLEKNNIFLYNKNVLLKDYPERDQISKILRGIIYIYEDLLINKKKYINYTNLYKLKPKEIVIREKVINKYLERIFYNVNLELFLDNLVIELSGAYENL